MLQNILKNKSRTTRESVIGWAFIIPALTLISLFVIVPMLYSLYLVTQSCYGIVCETDFFGNLSRLANDVTFRQALVNTFIFFLIQVPIMLTFALLFAVILNNPKLKGRGIFRTMIFLPAVTSLVAYSVLFKMMLAPDGIVNIALGHVGISPIGWLSHPTWQRVTIIVALLWRWTGYNMIFYLSGLQGIDNEIFEAAQIDGANKRQTFFKITIPLLKPIILFTSVMSTIGTLQLFDEPYNIIYNSGTTISTMTLAQYVFNVSFKYTPNFGYAALIAYAIMFFAAILSLIQFKVAREDK